MEYWQLGHWPRSEAAVLPALVGHLVQYYIELNDSYMLFEQQYKFKCDRRMLHVLQISFSLFPENGFFNGFKICQNFMSLIFINFNSDYGNLKIFQSQMYFTP